MRAPLLFLLRWFLLPLQLFFFCLLRDSLHTVCVCVCGFSPHYTLNGLCSASCLPPSVFSFNVRLWVRAFTFTLQQFLFLSLWLMIHSHTVCTSHLALTVGRCCWVSSSSSRRFQSVLLSFIKSSSPQPHMCPPQGREVNFLLSAAGNQSHRQLLVLLVVADICSCICCRRGGKESGCFLNLINK